MKSKIKQFYKLKKTDRTILFLTFMTIGNSLVVLVKFILSISIPSLWFGVNAGFGIVLNLSRIFSIIDYRKMRFSKYDNIKEKIGCKNYLNNGLLLIMLGIMYFFVSSYMYYNGTNTTMHEYLTYLVALIAFWSIGTAIYGMIKYKRNNNPIVAGVKITNFANALTSIVLTQVVLLDTFNEEYDSKSINGYMGMAVSLIIMFLGLYMIFSIQKHITTTFGKDTYYE